MRDRQTIVAVEWPTVLGARDEHSTVAGKRINVLLDLTALLDVCVRSLSIFWRPSSRRQAGVPLILEHRVLLVQIVFVLAFPRVLESEK